MDMPSVQKRVRELGASLPPPEHRTPQYLQAFVVSEIKTWSGAVKAAGITGGVAVRQMDESITEEQ